MSLSTEFRAIVIQKTSIAAVFTLYVYEVLITFDREVELFWHMPFTRTTAMFLLNRYVSLLKYPVTLTTYIHVSQESCIAIIRLGEVLEMTPYIVWASFSAMRTHALVARTWTLSLAVFILLCVPVVTNIYFFTQSIPEVFDRPVQCLYIDQFPTDVYIPVLLFTRISAILGDAIVIVVIWCTTFRGWRAAVAANMKVSLAQMIIRDGSIYFVVLLTLNVLHIISAITTVFSGSIAYFEEPLIAIIISRVMLNLRGVDQEIHNAQDGDANFSELEFNLRSLGGVAEAVQFGDGQLPVDGMEQVRDRAGSSTPSCTPDEGSDTPAVWEMWGTVELDETAGTD
ncbi:hypothetical protein C2E23DRAFT_842165 [Lenzites betulinus]|nr:hypothetical protein C2E23DRAFT_842165 [Lenzites betulinus]